MQSNFLQLFIRTEFSEKKLLENKELYFNNGVTNTQAQAIMARTIRFFFFGGGGARKCYVKLRGGHAKCLRLMTRGEGGGSKIAKTRLRNTWMFPKRSQKILPKIC